MKNYDQLNVIKNVLFASFLHIHNTNLASLQLSSFQNRLREKEGRKETTAIYINIARSKHKPDSFYVILLLTLVNNKSRAYGTLEGWYVFQY